MKKLSTPETPAKSDKPLGVASAATCSRSFLMCDGCGIIHEENPDFIICDCGRIAARMEWATKEEIYEDYCELRDKLAEIHRSTGTGTDAEYARDRAHEISSENVKSGGAPL